MMMPRTLANMSDAVAGGLKKFKINYTAQKELNKLAKSGADDIEKAAKDITDKAAKDVADVTEKVAERKRVRNSLKEAKAPSRENADVVQQAINKGTTNAKTGSIKFTNESGDVYTRTKNPEWVKGDADKTHGGRYLYTRNGESIDGQDFGAAKKDFIHNGGTFESEIAEQISKTQAGEHAGIDFGKFGDFVGNHPGWAVGGAVGGGFLLNEILDDD